MSGRLFAAMVDVFRVQFCWTLTTTDNGVCYILSRLGLSHLKLRNEQKNQFPPCTMERTSSFTTQLVSGKTCKKKICAIIVSTLLALTSGIGGKVVFRLWSSPAAQEKTASWEKNSLLLRVVLRVHASHIFSSLEALAHTKWREALENPLCSAECVQLWLMKLTVCQSG